ncbi:MAG: ketoacyl-ACP synthase III [Deltaproteobacteria bacterium]|nr:ketoacyl-ACP synthase III [Deltaproteobacteria bacterium]
MGTDIKAAVLGAGMYVPPKVVTNDDLAKLMTTSDEWIVARTGIKTRHYVEGETGAADLAYEASVEACRNAGIEPGDLDCIVFSTLSPDYNFPGSGVLLQARLGAPGVPAIDIRNQCSGFIYGLSTADAFIRAGQYRRVLVVGSEVHSTGLDFSDRGRDVAVLFGDGAGAVVLGPIAADEGRGVLATRLHSDGGGAKDLWVEAPASRYNPRLTHEMLDAGKHYPAMNGKKVFVNAVRAMPTVVGECLAGAGLKIGDIDLFIPHQANLRICTAVQEHLGLSDTKVFNNIQKYGNTTAASIPIAVCEAQREGRLKRGDLLCIASFGSGYTWAAALIRW